MDWREQRFRHLGAAVDERKRLTAQVSGVVQGVGFRAFTVREARRAGLTGYARNCPDGTVEVVAEGPEQALLHLQATLRRGPAASRVERVRVAWSAATGEFSGFSVRHD